MFGRENSRPSLEPQTPRSRENEEVMDSIERRLKALVERRALWSGMAHEMTAQIAKRDNKLMRTSNQTLAKYKKFNDSNAVANDLRVILETAIEEKPMNCKDIARLLDEIESIDQESEKFYRQYADSVREQLKRLD